MKAIDTDYLFRSLSFTKSSKEIVDKAKVKVEQIKSKIKEREKRIYSLRLEYEIDDAALIQLLTAARKKSNSNNLQFTYTKSSFTDKGNTDKGNEETTIGAGVVNNILTENDYIESEKDQVIQLERIIRNLKPILRFSDNGQELPEQEFPLSKEDLDYLGF